MGINNGLYNGLVSTNPQIENILSTIGLKVEDIERFRDVDVPPYGRYRQIPLFTDDRFKNADECKDKNTIIVLTRTGGQNRKYHKDNWEYVKSLKNYVCDYDADFDSTYAFIEFSVDEDTMNILKQLDMNEKVDMEKMIRANMSTVKMIGMATGHTISDTDLYEHCKKITEDMLNEKYD